MEELGSLCKPKVEEIGKSICNGMPSGLRIVLVGKECVGLADCEEEKEREVEDLLTKSLYGDIIKVREKSAKGDKAIRADFSGIR